MDSAREARRAERARWPVRTRWRCMALEMVAFEDALPAAQNQEIDTIIEADKRR